MVSGICLLVSCVLGLYSAARTKIDFQKECESSQKILDLPGKIRHNAVDAAEVLSTAISGCRDSFVNCIQGMRETDTTVWCTARSENALLNAENAAAAV
jgi:hypothetical protein